MLLLLKVGTAAPWKSCRLRLHEPRSGLESRLLGLLKPLWTLSRESCLLHHHPTTAAIGGKLGLLLLLKLRILLLLELGILLLELRILLKLGVSSRKSCLHRILKALLALAPLRHVAVRGQPGILVIRRGINQ